MTYPHTSTIQEKELISSNMLPICCPKDEKNLQFAHPRVVIPIINGEGVCPYCGKTYQILDES